MKRKLWLLLMGFALFTLGFSQAWAQPRPGTAAPVITHSFAIERGRYMDVLKIYIEASDPDGDMLRIATVAYENGFGRHSPDWVFLKPQYRDRFVGYLQWNTHSTYGAVREWANVTLKVSVFDRKGNESNVVIVPFEFVSEVLPRRQAPAPFDQGNLPRLGHVMIELNGSGDSRSQ